MNLTEYFHNKFLHGHIINNDKFMPTIKLLELDTQGNNINTFYYQYQLVPNTNQKKIIPLKESNNQITYYQYAIQGPYSLYLLLTPYYYFYKLYNLEHGDCARFDYNYHIDIKDIDIEQIHNRLFSFILSKDKEKHDFGYSTPFRKRFKKMMIEFNDILHIFIQNNEITSKKTLSIDEFNDNKNDIQVTLLDQDNNSIYITNKEFVDYFSQDEHYNIRYLNNCYLLNNSNYYYLIKFMKNRINIICRFYKNTEVEVINRQLFYSLLAHYISTDEYKYFQNILELI